jgi:glutamyl-tRNA reductase
VPHPWAPKSSALRAAVACDRPPVKNLLARLNGKLTDDDRRSIEKAFALLQNQFLHGPISALAEETHAGQSGGGHTLLDALRKLFRLHDGPQGQPLLLSD